MKVITKPTRYYVHGDKHEEDEESYYNWRDDLFLPRGSFHNDLRVEFEPYSISLRGYRSFYRKDPAWYRPQKPINLFSGVKLVKTPFYRWLKTQQDRDDEIGDLACDVYRDSKFPYWEEELEYIKEYLCFGRQVDWRLVDKTWEEFTQSTSYRVRRIKPSLRFDILQRDNFRCRLCGASASNGKTLEIDHIKPVSKGGTDDPQNLWTLCFDCNRGKSVKELPTAIWQSH